MKILSQHYPDSSALSKTVYYALFDEISKRLIGIIQFEESISEIDLTESINEMLNDYFKEIRYSLEKSDYPDVILNIDSGFFPFSIPGLGLMGKEYLRLERTSLWKNK